MEIGEIMKKRIICVGGVTGGASAAARIRRLDEEAEIIIYEKGEHVSFSNCSLPYYLGGVVDDWKKLLVVSPNTFLSRYNIQVYTNKEVVEIDREKKRVLIRDSVNGEEYEDHYDTLILSPGASPIVPRSIQGTDHPHVFTIRNVNDVRKIDEYIKEKEVKNAAVIGGGFIGLETAENLVERGLHVSLIEAADQVLGNIDEDMVQILHKELMDHGVELILKDGLSVIEEDGVLTVSGKRVPAEIVILAIGVKPNSSLAKDAGLKITDTGSIATDDLYRTSDPDIYAVGDAIEVYDRITKDKKRLPLAYPAQMEARAAADALYGIKDENEGYLGSSVVKVFNLYAASTGLNEKQLQAKGIPYDYSYVITNDRVGIMPGAVTLHLKVLFAKRDGRLLGGQCIGKANADRRIDVLAALIAMKGSLKDLRDLDLCYAPPVSTAKDALHMAALVGLHILNEDVHQVHVCDVRKLVEEGACIVDVRERNEYERGHLLGAVNIPLSEFRERINEIPKDIPVYLHCRSSQRSYNALMALQNLGYTNVYNISGSFLGISLYEYAHDVLEDRPKILTEYNFR